MVELGQVRGDSGRSTSGERSHLTHGASQSSSCKRLSGTSVLALHGTMVLELLGGTHWHVVSAVQRVGW